MSTLLLLSLFLFSAGSPGLSNSAADAPVAADGSRMTSQAMPDAPSGFDRIQIDNSPGADQVCLKIRAFIFETNDDKVPKLVRETTCLPAVGAGAKRINGTAQPKLVPATGAHSY